LEVLELICKQYTTKDIADKMFLSPRTVDSHRNNLLLKTDSKNVAGLVIYALKNKLINLEKDIPFT
jgi:DNA-binding CsgD family transcriptional regulator